MTVNNLFENGIIDAKYRGVIPEKCTCGNELILDEKYTGLVCSDKLCAYRLEHEINKKLSKFNARLELNTIRLWNKKIKSIYQLFSLDKESYKIRQIPMYLHEIADLSCDRIICDISEELLYGFSSFTEFYNIFEQSEIGMLSARLGIISNNGLEIAYKIIDELYKYKKEFLYAENVLSVKKYNNVLNIVINSNDNKFEIKDIIETISNRNITVSLLGVVNECTDILIVDNKNTIEEKIATKINSEQCINIHNKICVTQEKIWISDKNSVINNIKELYNG